MMSVLNEQQQKAIDLVIEGHSLVLYGSQGTGKSEVIKQIIEECDKLNITYALTCTTGIACSVYPTRYKAQTIHRWAGIGDGRYGPEEIQSVITTSPKYQSTIQSIKKTQLLIIDECSMLSQRTFETVEAVCSLKDKHHLFGGMSIVLCGDYFQLPPVPNASYFDDGSFCFESQVFQKFFHHYIKLEEVHRQNEETLVRAIAEVSHGSPSEATSNFIRGLSRPLQASSTPVPRLFSTNELVDDFNRNTILTYPGPLKEIISEDSGDTKKLQRLLAPKKLWLKPHCPVMLLKNLSDTLVNGLLGTVEDVKDEMVMVHFPAIRKTIPIERFCFTVYDPRLAKDVAARVQFPLKLAFGMTIHKSQGQTLDRVEVDCSGIFQPGQLGVALGRVRSSEGLRVVNYTDRYCIKHRDKVTRIENAESQEPKQDKSCCRNILRPKKDGDASTFSVHDMDAIEELVCCDPENVYPSADDEFDEEFDQILSSIDLEGDGNLDLPSNLDVDRILQNLHIENTLTPVQFEINAILQRLDQSKYLQFCKKVFNVLTIFLKKAQPDPSKTLKFGDFWSAQQRHQNSLEYRMACLKLFEGEVRYSDAHRHITGDIFSEIRKFILKERASLIAPSSRNIAYRTVTEASRSRVRYIGGYCVAKVRHSYVKKKESHRYSLKEKDKLSYEKASCAVKILNQLKVEEHEILATTEDPASLLDVERKQNINRGLTNIPDELFKFFLQLTEYSLSLLVDTNLNEAGGQMFELCKSKIMSQESLFESFSKCSFTGGETLDESEIGRSENVIEELLQDMTLQVLQLEEIYQKIIKRFLLTLFNQFRKDLVDAFKVQKKMAHRKQVQVQGKPTLGRTKKPSSSVSVPSTVPLPSTSQAEPVPLPSTSRAEPVPQPSTSRAEPVPLVPLHADEHEDNVKDSIRCKACKIAEKEADWIQCDICHAWLHRNCAGLKHHMKWKKYQKKGSVFKYLNCQ